MDGVGPHSRLTNPKIIAVDIDDTLNTFTQTLRETEFSRQMAGSLPKATFDDYLGRLRRGEKDESPLLATDFSYFRYQIHQRCYELAKARPDGVEFMQWLRGRGWTIVICTARDLRRANAITRSWLADNRVPFDHLFMAWNKIVFCRAWGIAHLVDDDAFNIEHGPAHGVNVYFPVHERNEHLHPGKARGFGSFDELRPWIEG